MPWFSRREQRDDAGLCRPFAMIELQEQWVRLAAIHAWMFLEVIDEIFSILIAVSSHPRDFAIDVVLSIREVMLTPISGVADAAM
jgi:hypothetical protein